MLFPSIHYRLLPALLLLLAACGGAEAPADVTRPLAPTTFWNQYDADQDLLIDVRTGFEYNRGHLDGARHVNVFSTDFQAAFDSLDRETPIYLYCQSGGRSGRAAGILHEMGFKILYNAGGYQTLLARAPDAP